MSKPRELPSRLAFTSILAAGRWGGRALQESVTVFIEPGEVVVRLEGSGEEVAVLLPAIAGATWQAGVLTLYHVDEELQLTGSDALDQAWHEIAKRACTLPEVARTLRALGPRAAGGPDEEELGEARERFFAPLIQARRRLEGGEPVEWLVADFSAAALAARVRGALATTAHERHEASAPHQRAMEARLLDACESLLAALDRVDRAAHALRESTEARRFERWRDWAVHVRAVFTEADRSWRAMAAVLTRREYPTSPQGPLW